MAALQLHICAETYAFDAATLTAATHSYTWSDAGLDWSSVSRRDVYLTVPTPPAQVCPVPAQWKELWRGTVTVGDAAPKHGYVAASSVGDLSNPKHFDLAGTRYTVDEITGSTSGKLSIGFDKALSEAAKARLELFECRYPFPLTVTDVDATTHTYSWSSGGADWSSAYTREMALAVALPVIGLPDMRNGVQGSAEPGMTVGDSFEGLVTDLNGND